MLSDYNTTLESLRAQAAWPDRVSSVPLLDLPEAQLPGEAFTNRCETRAILPRKKARGGAQNDHSLEFLHCFVILSEKNGTRCRGKGMEEAPDIL